MGPMPKENLRDSAALVRLDAMIATNMLGKFADMKRNQRLSLNRTEHSCQIEGRVLAGRDAMRAICAWCSVGSESADNAGYAVTSSN
eukprot:388672-Pyramimonas_sp.AAC.1